MKWIEEQEVAAMMRPRDPFAHKGMMGHALIIAGSYGMAGAAVLATKACLRAGVGKVTAHVPKSNRVIMQVAVPEAILHLDENDCIFSEAVDAATYDSVGIGPGIGKDELTAMALREQLRKTKCPTVADADALSLMAAENSLLQKWPKGIIMTPHVGEAERLVGQCATHEERLQKVREFAASRQAYIILKGKNSDLCLPDGSVMVCPTGNAGMATAGSGDVLTGIITALLARKYSRQEACMLGVYIHGLAGDMAAEDLGMESLIAGDIINYLPKAFKRLQKD